MAASDRVWRFTGPCGAMVGCYQQHGHAGPCATVSEHGVEVPPPTPPAAGAPGGAEVTPLGLAGRTIPCVETPDADVARALRAKLREVNERRRVEREELQAALAAEQAARAAAERLARSECEQRDQWRAAHKRACDARDEAEGRAQRLAAELAAARGAIGRLRASLKFAAGLAAPAAGEGSGDA